MQSAARLLFSTTWTIFRTGIPPAFPCRPPHVIMRYRSDKDHQAMHSRRQGFSLVEVILAVTILCILIALLLPMFSKIRTASESAVCQANLRQLGAGALLFINDHNGELPHSQISNSVTNVRTPGIREYVLPEYNSGFNKDQDTVYTCPTLQKGPYPSGNDFHRNYSVNGHMFSESGLGEEERTYGTVSNMRDVLYPAQAVLYMDGRCTGSITSAGKGYSYGAYVRSAQWLHEDKMVQFPHNNKQNVVFLDGHVDSLTWEEAPYNKSKEPFWSGGGNLSAKPKQ